MIFKDSHTFPNGLYIDYEYDICKQYIIELNNIAIQDDLILFVEKWRYLCPDIVNKELSVDILIALRRSHDMQNEFVNKNDNLSKMYLNVLAPPQLVKLSLLANQYGVTTGVVLLQLYNNGMIKELDDGAWIIR